MEQSLELMGEETFTVTAYIGCGCSVTINLCLHIQGTYESMVKNALLRVHKLGQLFYRIQI